MKKILFQTSELESLLCKQEGSALAPAHMDLFDGGPSSRDDAFLRPALWEDIASSIRNIDPENANMLAPLGATHVKLEADEALLEECATPLLSPLEIKTERLCAPPAYAHPQPMHHPPHQQPQPAPSFAKYPPSRLVYMSPLTPPGSDQGSPGNNIQVTREQLSTVLATACELATDGTILCTAKCLALCIVLLQQCHDIDGEGRWIDLRFKWSEPDAGKTDDPHKCLNWYAVLIVLMYVEELRWYIR